MMFRLLGNRWSKLSLNGVLVDHASVTEGVSTYS
jgi:hypothetical protein